DSGTVTTLHPVRPAPAPSRGAGPAGGPADSAARGALPGAELLTSVLSGTGEDEQPVTHVHRIPARESRTLEWPDWVSAPLRARLEARGVGSPWRHQVEAAALAHEG